VEEIVNGVGSTTHNIGGEFSNNNNNNNNNNTMESEDAECRSLVEVE